MTAAGDGLTVAYALSKYQQPSQTFIDLEIAELRRTGVTVEVVAVAPGSVRRDDATYVSGVEASRALHAGWLLRHPVRYTRFATLAWRLRNEFDAGSSERVRWQRVPTIAATLRRAGVDVVHAHFGWSGASLAAMVAALLDVPWSMTLHANDIFARQRALALKLRSADQVVTVCDYNRRWMAEQGLPVGNVRVITCGVEEPAGRGPAEKSWDVATVGRLVPKKGIDTLIRAVAALAAHGLRPRTLVIGEGPERERLTELARELGVAELVEFAGSLPHAESLDAIAAARVFCLPCRIAPDGDRDAMPTVIIEAMMRAVPVVTTRVVGIPEMVDEAVGRLTAPDDVAAVAEAIRELLEDPETATVLGKAGAERARERFAVATQTAAVRDMFGEMMSRR